VRELENVINRARILAEGDCVTVADLPASLVGATRASVDAAFDLAEGGLREQLQRVEREIIGGAVEAAQGDRRAAARRLGISLSSLYRKLGE
jgi:DNA-binding NtrC family response regulator